MNEEVMARPQVHYRGKVFYLSVDRYPENDGTRVCLTNDDGGVEYTATMMHPHSLPDSVFYIKDWSENAGIAKALITAHLVEPTGKSYRIGSRECKEFSATERLAAVGGFALAAPAEPLAIADDPDPVPGTGTEPEVESRLEELAPDLEIETTDMRIEREANTDKAGWFKPPLDSGDEMPADATAGVPDPDDAA